MDTDKKSRMNTEQKRETKLLFLAAMPEGAATPPEAFQVFPYGSVTLHGEEPFVVDEAAMDAVVRRFRERGLDMVVDYEHQTEGKEFVSPDGTAPAAGWIKTLENRGRAGLWAVVEWTRRAALLLANREYRYFSPVFLVSTADRRLVELLRVALTNAPRLNQIQPLVAKEKENESMQWWKKYATKLGLPEDASEAEVTKALEVKLGESPRVVVARDVLDALGLGETAGTSEVIATIHALKQKPDLTADVAALKARLAERDRDDFVAAALKSGKITPAHKEWALDYALKDPEGFKIFVAKAAQVVPVDGLGQAPPDRHGAPALDDTVMRVAKMFGNTPDDLKNYGRAGA